MIERLVVHRRGSAMLAAGALSVAVLAGCGGKTSAAAPVPPPAEAAFDPAGSDPAAVAIVDEMLAGVGGRAAWDGMKQLSFTVEYMDGDTVAARFTHAWSRADPAAADERLREDLAFLGILHTMKDPGVSLSIDGDDIKVEGSACQPSCTTVKVERDAEPGSATWYVNINNETKQAQVIEKQVEGGRIGYELAGWTDAGGLRLPTRFQNLGLPSEVIVFSDVAVR